MDPRMKFGFHSVLIWAVDRSNEAKLLFVLLWDVVSDLTELRVLGIAVWIQSWDPAAREAYLDGYSSGRQPAFQRRQKDGD